MKSKVHRTCSCTVSFSVNELLDTSWKKPANEHVFIVVIQITEPYKQFYHEMTHIIRPTKMEDLRIRFSLTYLAKASVLPTPDHKHNIIIRLLFEFFSWSFVRLLEFWSVYCFIKKKNERFNSSAISRTWTGMRNTSRIFKLACWNKTGLLLCRSNSFVLKTGYLLPWKHGL